jgi:hypothetical protein
MPKIGRLLVLVTCVALISIVFATTGHTTITWYFTKADFDAAVSTTLLEDFESFVPKDTQFPSFTSNGVTYAGFVGFGGGNVWVASPGYTNFGAGVPQPTDTSILTADGPEDFTANFSTPYGAVGFDTYFNGLAPTTVAFYDAQGPLGTIVLDVSLNNKGYLGVVSTDPITSFRWTNMMGGTLNTGIDNISVATQVFKLITIDIKPGSDLNSINFKNKGKIPVAILSTIDFDAPSQVDQTSLTFGSTGDEPSLAFCNPKGEDINRDGFRDLICHFYTQFTEFQCDDTEGILKGTTMDDTPIEGRDSVRIVPCK